MAQSDTQFKKGNTLAKGKKPSISISKIPEIVSIRKYTKIQIEEQIRDMLGMTVQTIQYIAKQDITRPLLERALANVMLKAYEKSDTVCLGFILDKILGKKQDLSSVILDVQASQVIEKQDTPKDDAIIYEVVMSDAAKFKYPRPRLIASGTKN